MSSNLYDGFISYFWGCGRKIDKLIRDFLGKAAKKEAGTWLKWEKLTLNKKQEVWALKVSVSTIRMALEIQF